MQPLDSISGSLLGQKRLELQLVNTSLFKLILKRKEVSKEIQDIKGTQDLFDLDREVELFESMAQMIRKLSLQELLAFSLIMEDQANAGGNYPRWSEKIHLEAPTNGLIDQINPILLFFYQMNYYRELKLNESWKEKLKNLS